MLRHHLGQQFDIRNEVVFQALDWGTPGTAASLETRIGQARLGVGRPPLANPR